MNKQLREALERLTSFWGGLTRRQKINLLSASGVLILVAALLTSFGLQKHYVPVFSNLDDASAGEVITKLQSMKIDYKVSGNTIEVPDGMADQVRMQLAEADIPKSGSFTYNDLFNQSGMLGMTDNMFNAKYQAVLESNIAATIKSIDGVSNAQVQIVMPQDHLFVDQAVNDAKASVFVELKPGVSLGLQQVTGIQQLVAHSVKGLLPNNVTVIDQKGIRISPDPQSSSDSIAFSSQELDEKNQIESAMTNKVRDAVEGLVGAGNAVVTVNADVSFDKVHTTANTVSPVVGSSGVVISDQKSSQSSQGTSPAGMIVGTQTQNPNASNIKSATSSNSTSSSATDTVNYDVNHMTTDTVQQPYTVKQYSVAVVVNGNMSPQLKSNITSVVASTIGVANTSIANGLITVVSSQLPASAKPAFAPTPFYQQPAVMGGIAVGALLLGAGLFFFVSRRSKRDELELLEEPAELPSLAVEESEQQKMKKQLEKLVDQKPEEFVNLLRTWLVEE